MRLKNLARRIDGHLEEITHAFEACSHNITAYGWVIEAGQLLTECRNIFDPETAHPPDTFISSGEPHPVTIQPPDEAG